MCKQGKLGYLKPLCHVSDLRNRTLKSLRVNSSYREVNLLTWSQTRNTLSSGILCPQAFLDRVLLLSQGCPKWYTNHSEFSNEGVLVLWHASPQGQLLSTHQLYKDCSSAVEVVAGGDVLTVVCRTFRVSFCTTRTSFPVKTHYSDSQCRLLRITFLIVVTQLKQRAQQNIKGEDPSEWLFTI